jgi:hypothetical protein
MALIPHAVKKFVDGKIAIRLMDENEVADDDVIRIDPIERTVQIVHGGGIYGASRQLEDGTWIYRRSGTLR